VRELALLFRASFQHHGIITQEEEEDVLLKKGGKMFFFLDDKNHHSTLFFSFPFYDYSLFLFYNTLSFYLFFFYNPPPPTICPNIDSPHLSLVDTHTQLCLDGEDPFCFPQERALLVHIFASHFSSFRICFTDFLSYPAKRKKKKR
jgi:hypothetical protein